MTERLDHLRRDQPPNEVFSSARRLIKGWTPTGTYGEACALVTGYMAGRDPDMTADFQLWLVGRFGGEVNVAFWSHALHLALPDVAWSEIGRLSAEQNALAVDRLFALLLEWMAETAK